MRSAIKEEALILRKPHMRRRDRFPSQIHKISCAAPPHLYGASSLRLT